MNAIQNETWIKAKPLLDEGFSMSEVTKILHKSDGYLSYLVKLNNYPYVSPFTKRTPNKSQITRECLIMTVGLLERRNGKNGKKAITLKQIADELNRDYELLKTAVERIKSNGDYERIVRYKKWLSESSVSHEINGVFFTGNTKGHAGSRIAMFS